MVFMSIISLKENHIVIFTDGAARGNPGPGGFGAIAIYPNAHGEPQVDEIGGRENLTTNNRMELKAVIEAIKNFIGYYQNLSEYSFTIYIDSGYVVKGATEWLSNWKRKNWITTGKEDVKNKDLWMELDRLLQDGDGKVASVGLGFGVGNPSAPRIGAAKIGVRKSRALKIEWKLIEGHAGVWGNERCDVIATSYADNKPVALFTGPLTKYVGADGVEGGENILNIKAVHQARKDAMKARKSDSSSRGNGKEAYSYVSMVGGKINADKTWAECEKRVKGKSGARFRKVFSMEEELELKKEFGSGSKG